MIAVVDKSKENGRFKLVKEEGVYGNAPKWLEVDAEKLTAKVVALPPVKTLIILLKST